MKESVTIKGKFYKIRKSGAGNFYIENSFYVDYQIPNPMTFASKFGNLSAAKIPSFVDEQQFSEFLAVIESINNLSDGFIKEIKRIGCLGNFISNLYHPFYYQELCPTGTLECAFCWSKTPEGFEYWNDVFTILEKIEKGENYENRLQKQEIDRSGGDRSEGSRICCERDKSRFRLSYTQYRERVDYETSKTCGNRVNISIRHSRRLRY